MPVSLVATEDADDDATDTQTAAVHEDRLHRRVARFESGEISRWVVALQGGFAVVDEGHHGFAGAGRRAGFDEDIVAMANLVFNHGLTLDLQHEAVAVLGEEVGEPESFAVFDGVDGLAGRDLPEDGDGLHGLLDGGVDQLDRAGEVGFRANPSLGFESLHVFEDGDPIHAEAIADFVKSGRQAIL